MCKGKDLDSSACVEMYSCQIGLEIISGWLEEGHVPLSQQISYIWI